LLRATTLTASCANKWGCRGAGGEPSANATLWRIANNANSLRARMQHPRLRTNIVGRGKRHRKRRHMKRAAARLERRIRNLASELHRKLAPWVCQNYDTVLLPSFQVSEMVEKRDRRGRRRKIGRRTMKEMYSLRHYAFRAYLVYLASRYGTQVVFCDEAYTTKTCGSCGLQNAIGGSEVYKCAHCGAPFDRDENAARNILLKYIVDSGISIGCHSPSL